jgi:hypothetical protein
VPASEAVGDQPLSDRLTAKRRLRQLCDCSLGKFIEHRGFLPK